MQEVTLDVGPSSDSQSLPTMDTLEFQDIAHTPAPRSKPAGGAAASPINIPMHDMKSSSAASGGSAAFPLFDPADMTVTSSPGVGGAYDGHGPMGSGTANTPAAPGGPASGTGAAAGSDVPTSGNASGSAPKPDPSAGASFYQLAYYRSYFDVTTVQMAWRLARALVPTSSYFYSGEDDKPDLYGPFWITTTLVFLMAATGNFASYLSSGPGKIWQSDMEKVSLAATVFYSFILPVPIAIWIALRQWATPKSLVLIISLYGYSLLPFLFACVICIAPIELVRWLAVTVCAVLSSRFLIRNLADYGPNLTPDTPMDAADGDAAAGNNAGPAQTKRNLLIILAVVAALHIGLAVVTKFYFFEFVSPISAASPSVTPPTPDASTGGN